MKRCVNLSFSISVLEGVLIGSHSPQVEVEVRRNVFGPENAERLTSRFVGGESEVRGAVGDYLRWLKEDSQKRAEGIIDDLKSAEEEIKRRLSPRIHDHTLDPSQQVVEEIHRSTSEPIEEGGWASDDSDTRASRPTVPKSLGGKKPKRKGSVKTKYIRHSTPNSPNDSPEHSKARGDRSATPSPHRYGRYGGSGIPVLRTTSWDVGSPYRHSRPPSMHTDSRRGSVRNLRIESLRTAGIPGSPRELSPARSVRFADSHPPRTPLSTQGTFPSTLQQQRPEDKEEGTSGGGRIAFELPGDKN